MLLIPPQPDSIAHASQEAIRTLTALSEAVQSPSGGEEVGTSAQKHSDEIERLEIWIREHDIHSGKLDHKLREASHLRDRVLSLLAKLSEVSAHYVPADGTGTNEDESSRLDSLHSTDAGIETLVPPYLHIRDDHSVESTSLSLDTNFTSADSLPDSPLTHIHDVITLLFDLGQTLLDPTPHSRLERSAHPDAAQHDINHVRARFPNADKRLIDRLGRANWERRQYLRKLRVTLEESSNKADHTDHIPQDIKLVLSDSASESEESDESASSTNESLRARLHGKGNTSDREPSVPASRTLTATSTPSEFQFSINDTQSTAVTEPSKGIAHVGQSVQPVGTRYRVSLPPHPNEHLTGEKFHCPFCAYMISDMKSPADWKKHVFDDWQPYMCTYADCVSSAKTYGSRKCWWEHETERHRVQRSWICTPCEQEQCKSVFETSASFEEHVVNDHPVKLTSTQLQNIRDMCQRDIGRRRPHDVCPLCQETIACKSKPGTKAIERVVKKHVSEHLEQLAFFVAYPAGQTVLKEDDSEFQDDSDSEDGLQSEIRSIASKDTHLSKKEIHFANVKAFIADQQRAADDPEATSLPDPSIGAAQGDPQRLGQVRDVGGTVVASFPIFTQMPPPNEHFYSRQSLLTDVDKGLHPPGLICIVHGVGGVGKTLVAVQYSYIHKQHYDAIFWLQADTTPGLADSYLQMVMALGIANSLEDHNHVVAKGRNWLQETEKRWLLVFDNLLQWEDISRYLPNALRRTQGSVLITTQAENLLPPRAEGVTKIRINPLNQHAGSEMLLRYLDRDVRNDPEQQLAREISAFVGGLPVAIAHVAGYVSYSRYSLEEVIETFREWRKRTGVATDEADDLPATFREASFSYDGMLEMVWEVTLRELSQDARDVLNILAYLNCATVPRNMLWGMHEDPSLQFLDTRESLRMRRINNSLIKRRLIVDTDASFSMHRSLQRGIREELSQDKGKQQTVFDQAVALVREAFPRSNPLQQPTPDKWSECRELLPHLHALHDVYHGSRPQIKGSIDFAQLLLDAGMDQFEQGITREGLLLLNTAEIVLDAASEPSPQGHEVMKADIHAMIAIMYDDTGIEKRQQALTRREMALNIRKKIFEEAKTQRRKDEILVFNSWMEYAISLLHYHRYEEAEPIIEKCLVKFREWGPEEEIPFEYAKYYNKIALVRMYQGRFDEAIDLAARSVQLMEKTGYNLFTSRFRFDMACIILQSGDLDRALRVHEEIHDRRIEMVTIDNQLSLHSMYAIGAIHELKGDLCEAEKWFRKILDQRRSLTSWPDEAYSRAQFHLARVLVAQGRAEDVGTANSLQNKALEVLHRLLPLDHPPELTGVTDEAILFDHMLPVSPGGPRFTGRGLLEQFMRKT